MLCIFFILRIFLISLVYLYTSTNDLIINISSFTEVSGFKKRMDKMLRMLLETPPSPGNDRVIYPGVIEHEEYQDRMKNGIPYHKEVVAWLETTIKEFNLPKLEIF